MFFERSKVPATVQDITVQPAAGTAQQTAHRRCGGHAPLSPAAGGVTTPPADPAEAGHDAARLDPAGRGAE